MEDSQVRYGNDQARLKVSSENEVSCENHYPPLRILPVATSVFQRFREGGIGKGVFA